jgi:hypothetical protein
METRRDVQTDVPGTLDGLITAARQRMEEAGYTPSTRTRYSEVWSALKQFALTVEKTDRFSVDTPTSPPARSTPAPISI